MPSASASPPVAAELPPGYKWTALSNTTLGAFMATLDSSIVIISLPAIFRGIGLDPLEPSNISYLLWMLMGYLVVTAVLVVTFGRLGDIFGRVRMYNAGFAVFTAASIALSLTPGTGSSAAIYLIVMRVVQGVGGSMLLANSTAIITDAFPVEERGKAMGINAIAAIAGSFIGLILGGVLADWDWRLVFWVNVPFGIFGTSGRTGSCGRPAPGCRPASTGWATSPSPSAWWPCSPASPTGSSPTAATSWAGPARSC